MTVLPSLFVSHGAPNLALYESPTKDFLGQLAQQLPRPEAILIMSAHFETKDPTFEIGEKPGMIYDFGGFEPELYQMVYPAPGAPELAQQAAGLAQKAGLNPVLSKGRGYDHGVWVMLKLLYPQADIPVAMVSVQPGRDGAHHVALGRAVAPLRQDGVLIIGSGGATHNLRAFFGGGAGAVETAPWVEEFNEWVFERASAGDEAAIAHWEQGPQALKNHPSPEHFQPFPFAYGAGGPGAKGKRINHDYVGPISLDAYTFE